MKKNVFGFIALLLLLIACQEEDINDFNADNYIYSHDILIIDTNRKAVYDENDNRYIQKTFTTTNFTHNFKLTLSSGKTYRIIATGVDADLLNFNLYNSKEDLVATSTIADVGKTREMIEYSCPSYGDYYISLIYTVPINTSVSYRLIVEELGTQFVYWQGFDWECDGDWKVMDNGSLRFRGHESFYNKWIRMCNVNKASYSAHLIFTDSLKSSSMNIGLAINASSDIYSMINLPSEAMQFKTNNSGNWELWNISLSGLGIDIKSGKEEISSFPITLKIAFQEPISFYFDEKLMYTATNLNKGNCLYITVEDTEKNTVYFTDFSLKTIN